MYAVSAQLQNAPLIQVPLVDDAAGFHADVPAIITAAQTSRAKLVFLCSPSNPVGVAIPLQQIETILQTLAGTALVVVDEAYGEFSDVPSVVPLLAATHILSCCVPCPKPMPWLPCVSAA